MALYEEKSVGVCALIKMNEVEWDFELAKNRNIRKPSFRDSFSLKQNHSKNKEGMDISLCVIDWDYAVN